MEDYKKGETIMSKLEKYQADLEKARKKYEEWGNKVRELEKKYKEEEKTTVHEMMSSAQLTPEQLAQIIRLAKAGEIYYGKQEENCKEEVKHEE